MLFGKNGVDAEGAGIYGSQSRDDFDRDYVEQYFNYMGMLAVDGTYDKMEALLNQNIHPVDILLMLAASEGFQVAGCKRNSSCYFAVPRHSKSILKNLAVRFTSIAVRRGITVAIYCRTVASPKNMVEWTLDEIM
ncbi:Protein LHCP TRANSLOCATION DEFECT [Hibiscus syriacus]|uniref:Protein LHCP TRANSLOCATION DEFECT n=1 Tax=Hibiscus syriacus TaxID=106335 RepID=A0A6A3D6A4_HIBSY|nr:Protein LHCP TRANSLOCATION DEFECT [Hibiscus syriacus]